MPGQRQGGIFGGAWSEGEAVGAWSEGEGVSDQRGCLLRGCRCLFRSMVMGVWSDSDGCLVS